ncbi:hypothetical protein EHEL_020050 [Encephalitozoon hellem ATCC 50504]|uniref:CTLH/CRA C-terminal to LisH motif domain-containing protein n=1 Tax=Encephalitozoon hellem TaxID=27973 RepID=A0A9Q9CAP3_ENCHE|nr:uncharacterized protein EHEL_020050 [Encephalitozoon hellem ATCC 50504]AFM97762.1 hypothetical protein EHEL_020050 [Encephalitozoon hellem ATCC 50504]UTX42529.1 hypothetical protein GPU96_02g02390 [Encephalitozoon hellem]WEL37984.1 hypothetical protein PFJ87_02g00200 [Encephalitozoon hellem]|eukprot:XP_003886743.1 hypothetical protein EHEL_020050 [Encephalitozoon hellem ATCC 50504]
MDLSTIQKARISNTLRTTCKLMERLFQMYRNRKISKEEYMQKLEKLKEVVGSNIDEMERDAKVIASRREPTNVLSVFIMEHFEHIGCFDTALLLANKFSIKNYSDSDFYKLVYGIKSQIESGMFEEALSFCREHRVELKSMKCEEAVSLENDLKIEKFIEMCHAQEFDKALEFVNKEFKRVPEQIKSYLPILVSNSNFRKYPFSRHNKTAEQFLGCALKLFRRGFKSRLMQRIEYGMMAYKTYRCIDTENNRCPACCRAFRLREDVPFNKHEISILLCRGSSEEMDDTNQPYVFEDGLIYGSRYIESSDHICISSKSTDSALRYPRLCFIL